jgi:CubicO group peptidase (beta-lactamase class C family)
MPFIIGSISKSFTAAAIMQLAEQGMVDIDAPITAYLQIDMDNKVTIRNLLHQTSGLLRYQTRSDLTVHKEFGSHVYANINYTLLGDVVEAVSGLSYEEYIKKHIFAPLSFTQSHTSIKDIEGLAVGYQNFYGFPVERTFPYPEKNDTNGYLSVPTSHIISGMEDMGRYLQAYLRNGEGFLSEESVNTILYTSVPVPDTDEKYAMGWNETAGYKERLFYHGGLVQNYNTVVCLLPDSGKAVVLFCNMGDYFAANELFSALCIDVVRLLMGMDAKGIKRSTYGLSHLFINLLYLGMLAVSIIPFLQLRRWVQLALHLAYPLLLVSIPLLLGVPYFAAWAFTPDLMLVLLFSAVLALICGAVKLGLWTGRAFH